MLGKRALLAPFSELKIGRDCYKTANIVKKFLTLIQPYATVWYG
jgi:hypothetical protein